MSRRWPAFRSDCLRRCSGWAGGWAGLPPLVTAGLVIGAVALGSRGLHLDGLADTADGLAASYDRAEALEIMRRGNTGPIGAVALVLVLLIQTASAAAVLGRDWGPVAIGVLVCLARCSLLISCAAGVRAARPEGWARWSPAWCRAGGRCRAASRGGGELRRAVADRLLVVAGLAGVLIAAVVVIGLVRRTGGRFGGITGDVLGAGIELSLAALLVVASASA